MNFKFWPTVGWNWPCFTITINYVSIILLKSSIFLHSRSVTFQRYAMINSNANRLETYFTSVSKFIKECKRCYLNFWTYLIFLYSYHVLSKSLYMEVFSEVFEEFYIFAVIMDPFRTSLLAPCVLNIFC